MMIRNVAKCILLSLLGMACLAHAGEKKPLKVYILVGQSNMQGQAKVSTIPAMAWDPVNKTLHDKFVDKDGKPKVYEDVQVAAFSQSGGWGSPTPDQVKNGSLTVGFGGSLTADDRLGPELGFGVTMFEHLDQPILIIKTSWGGKSLHTDFRPPSGGPYYESTDEVKDRKTHKGEIITAEKQIADKIEATGKYYRLMSSHVKKVLADPGKYHSAYDKEAGYEIAGVFWFQGFNDMVGPYPVSMTKDGKKGPKDYSLYSKLMACFIRDVRKEFEAPKLPFVIGVLGVGGYPEKQPNGRPDNLGAFRKAMAAPAAMPEFKGNVVAVHTAKYWDMKLDELLNRFKAVTDKNKVNADDKYSELRKKFSPLIKEHQKIMTQLKPIEKKLNDVRKKKIKLSEAELKDIKALQRTIVERKKLVESKLNKAIFSEDELREKEVGRSNQAYHYNGSAKILGRIGEAFANALNTLK